ncbi:SGNH/GDSL hydrolase family protein [Nonomuraea sp. NPDC049152]|uniref:SGNH/GDSL hydrolase family protein n=1 Tax=Nonomuraea sp. NPDC049152 TaxID=3154350 RepID=UPI0033D896E5
MTSLFRTLFVATMLLAVLADPADAGSNRWTVAWATAVHQPTPHEWVPTWAYPGFRDQSVRQVIRVGARGSRVRIRLSNRYGTAPLRLTGASVGRAGAGAAVRPASLRGLRFGGSARASVPAGGELVSDPLLLPVQAGERLAVTLYFSGATGPATYHNLALTTSYRADGNHLHDRGASAYRETSTSWYYLTGLEVSGMSRPIVAFGDSITDGYGATLDRDDRYPDELARRLARVGPDRPVLNAGIGGNRLLNDSACLGERATARFQRDALGPAAGGTVIVLVGVNDILMSDMPSSPCTTPQPVVTARELITGYRELIRSAQASRVTIIAGTLTPFKGADYYSERAERVRSEINEWIRTGGEFDAIVDFDRVLADPADTGRMRPAYDSGDHLHPNGAGYRAMAAAAAESVSRVR